jgi:hypothetical protein
MRDIEGTPRDDPDAGSSPTFTGPQWHSPDARTGIS